MISRKAVIKWLQSGCDFNLGLSLLPADGFLSHFHSTCKIQGATKSNCQMLEYQLCKAANITEAQAKHIKTTAPKQKQIIAVKTVLNKIASTDNSQSTKISEQVGNTPDSERIVNIAKNKAKLREDYPFLQDKNCPDEFKILVADKITAYHNYVDAHPKLMGYKTLEEAGELSKEVIDNYLENRLIHEELEYYKKKNKILGKHKIFKQFAQLRTIRKKTTPELIKLKKQLEMNIWRNNKLIKDDPKNILNENRKDKIKNFEIELKEVNALLKIDE